MDLIRVFLVEYREAVRQVLAAALSGHRWIELSAKARSALQAVAEAVKVSPDVAVVDAGLPDGQALQATRLLTRRVPTCRVLLVNGDHDPPFLLASLEAGARGYLTRHHGLGELLTAIRVVNSGELAVPRGLLADVLPILLGRRQNGVHERLDRLTAQEQRVLLLLAQGADNRVMAERLGISPHTARTHVDNVLHKLDVHSRLEAVAFVNRHGLLELLEGAVHRLGNAANATRGRTARRVEAHT